MVGNGFRWFQMVGKEAEAPTGRRYISMVLSADTIVAAKVDALEPTTILSDGDPTPRQRRYHAGRPSEAAA